jgi:hypothetical protein
MVLRVLYAPGAACRGRRKLLEPSLKWHQDIYYINSLDTFSIGVTRLRLIYCYYTTFVTNGVTLKLPFI